MQNTLDDKSVVKEYYKNEGEQSHVSSDGHINLSAQALGLQLHLSDDSLHQTSTHIKSFIPRIPPRRLAFCGGAVQCIVHVGVLKELSRYNMLSCVKECIGISAGCIISLAYILGYTCDEIERLTLGINYDAFMPSFEPEILLTFFNPFFLTTKNIPF